jgi:hypothetical protein
LALFSTSEGPIGQYAAATSAGANTFLMGATASNNFGLFANNSYASPQLFIKSDGNVGIGTTNPARPLEIANGRLRFSNSLGDIEFTEVADLIASATTASPNPTDPAFRLHTGSNAAPIFTVLNNGFVGIGTATPGDRLHVDGGSNSAIFAISTGGTGVAGASTTGNGVRGHSTSYFGVWGSSHSSYGVYGSSVSGYAGFFSGKTKVAGHLEVESCTGCTISSDRNLKANFSTISPRSVLDRLAALPIRAWNYKKDEPSVRHVGPMAQDFRAAFNLGADDKHIDMIDANGVTMAAIQGLYQQNKELASEVKHLRAQSTRQQAQLDRVKRTIKRKSAPKR